MSIGKNYSTYDIGHQTDFFLQLNESHRNVEQLYQESGGFVWVAGHASAAGGEWPNIFFT